MLEKREGKGNGGSLDLAGAKIVDFEFAAYDFHKPAIIGLHEEFVSSPRLDNLASSLCALDSIIDYH